MIFSDLTEKNKVLLGIEILKAQALIKAVGDSWQENSVIRRSDGRFLKWENNFNSSIKRVYPKDTKTENDSSKEADNKQKILTTEEALNKGVKETQKTAKQLLTLLAAKNLRSADKESEVMLQNEVNNAIESTIRKLALEANFLSDAYRLERKDLDINKVTAFNKELKKWFIDNPKRDAKLASDVISDIGNAISQAGPPFKIAIAASVGFLGSVLTTSTEVVKGSLAKKEINKQNGKVIQQSAEEQRKSLRAIQKALSKGKLVEDEDTDIEASSLKVQAAEASGDWSSLLLNMVGTGNFSVLKDVLNLMKKLDIKIDEQAIARGTAAMSDKKMKAQIENALINAL